ncbi:MAG TPA: hypothetical protein VLS89_10980, partial [Candidatus Nanopelagicales bacterium]|nr:hypothetical protein [Candidatus Nanopelagicales bacterium]
TMSLPALSLSFLRGWPSAARIVEELRQALLGRVIALPSALAEAEREAIVDAVTLLLDLPARALASPADTQPGVVYVIPAVLDQAPAPVKGAIVLCVVRRIGPPRLDMPPEVRLLRDAVIEHWGLEHSGTVLQWVASWLATTVDTPGTAIRFAGAALAQRLAEPESDTAALYLAGLSSTIGWLLRGVDVRVAQWVLALATRTPNPERLVGTDAALLGRDAALLRAFEAGLLEGLPDEPGDPLDLRRPLEILGDLADAPGAPSLAMAAAALAPHLDPMVHSVLERLLQPPMRRLGLSGPRPPRPLVGRDAVLRRLVMLCEPGNEVRTTVLYGLDGMGKGAVAASLCELLVAGLEPVWLRFAEGAEEGWSRVATALGMDLSQPGQIARDRTGVPRWVRRVHDILRRAPYLVVADEVDTIPEDELAAWLPGGQGACAVLVLSRSAQRPLQRARDAIAVSLGPVSIDSSRSLLATKAPHLAEAIARGDADRLIDALGGSPGALVLASSLLEKAGLPEATEIATRGEQAVPQVLRKALAQLSVAEKRILLAMAVCAPGGSPPELPLAIARGKPPGEVMTGLQDRSFIIAGARTVRLAPLVRLAMERRLEQRP